MGVGADIIDMVKINTQIFFKEIIENCTGDWLEGLYLMLRIKTMVPGGSPIIAIFYKYDMRKVLYILLLQIMQVLQN